MRNLCGVVAPSVVAPSVVAPSVVAASVVALCLAVLVACGSTDSDVVREGGAAAEQPGPDLSAPEDVAEPPAEAERSPSGLASRVLVGGSGTRSPTALDTVRVHYTGWQTDGTRFDSSVARGQPSEFSLNQVIAGWTEGLQLMVEGEKRRLWIPEALAYGGRAGRPAGMLVFDVELLAIVSAAP